MNTDNSITLTIKSSTGTEIIVRDASGTEYNMPLELCDGNNEIDTEFQGYIFDDNGSDKASAIAPIIAIDEFSMLKLINLTPFYAEMDNGLGEYYLKVPLREQVQNMNEGESYLVYYHDDKDNETKFGSCKIDSFLFDSTEATYEAGQKVKLQAYKFTHLGVKVIVDDQYEGLLYDTEVFQDIGFGEVLTGYTKKNRPDNKIDVTLQPFGFKKVEENTQKILDKLKEQDGVLHLGDKSDPESIALLLSMSKKTFKKAIGGLYKQGLIKIEPKSIELIK